MGSASQFHIFLVESFSHTQRRVLLFVEQFKLLLHLQSYLLLKTSFDDLSGFIGRVLLIFNYDLIHFSFENQSGLLSTLGSGDSSEFGQSGIICLLLSESVADYGGNTWSTFSNSYLFVIIFFWFFIQNNLHLAEISLLLIVSSFSVISNVFVSFCFAN